MIFRLPQVLLVTAILATSAFAQKRWQPLKMELPRQAQMAIPLHLKPKTDRLYLSIGIPLRNPIGLKSFVDAVSDPRSPNYRQFLTPEMVGMRFGQAQANVDLVSNYLRHNGISVKLVAKNRLSILAECTVAQAEAAFQTSIMEYQAFLDGSSTPVKRFGFTSAPSVPSEIRPFVSVIGGLENFLRPKHCGTLTFDQLRTLYNDVPLYSSVYQGQGRTVAISNWDGYRLSNIQLEYSHFNLPTPAGGIGSNVSVVSIGGQDGNTSTAQGEGDIDIQCVLGASPLSNLIIYDNASQSDLLGVLTQEANDNKADLITESYGWATDGYNAYFEQVHQVHLSMSAQGITYLCASGDSGAQGVASYQYPDEDPDVLCIGGTTVSVDNAGNRVSEVVWNNSIGAAGGGYSQTTETFNTLPAYQKGTGVPKNIPYRLVPDFSLDADPYTGYQIYIGGTIYFGYGGTSCASPLAAGSLALVEQELIAKGAIAKDGAGNQRLGRINDLIYSFNGDPTVFFDVVSGNNGLLPNNSISNALTGWDTASGWGSPNFNGIVNKILSIPTPTSVSLSPTTVIGGTTSTGTVTISQPAGASGTVINLSTSDVSASVPATVTVAAGATTANFGVSTVGSAITTTVNVIASAAGGKASAVLTITPIQVTSMTINLTPVVGGNQTSGTVTLNGPAPTGGMGISLTTSNGTAVVPLNVEVAAGSTTGTFTINTIGVSTPTTVTITGSDGTNTVSANLTVNPASLSSVSVAPSTVAGGNTAIGTVTLNGFAPNGGLAVSLNSSSGLASLPPTVTVPSGSTSATFNVATSVVQTSSPVTITATQGANSSKAQLTITPAGLSGLTFLPTSVQGGSPSTGTITLNGPAPSGGLTINLASSDPSTTVPSSVVVIAGSTSATFTTSTSPVATSTSATITATQGSNSQKATLTVTPAVLVSLTLNPSSVIGGNASTGTVNLSGAAGPGGATVSLSTSSSNATVPVSVVVAAGQTSATFQVATGAVASATSVNITAAYGVVNATSTLTIGPTAINTLVISPSAVVGGLTTTGTITLNGTAPSGGVIVNLNSTSNVASVPQTVTVQAGSNSASFTVSTISVANDTPATISASQNGVTLTASVIVQVPYLASLNLNPTSVVGGNSSTGTITLVRPAPQGGITISLSSDSGLALVNQTVTIPSGSSSGTFTVATGGTATSLTANITASLGGTSRSAPLVITPALLANLSVAPASVIGGNPVTGTVSLSGKAPGSGVTVMLIASSASVVLPTSVKIPAGASQASFDILTKPVATTAHVTIAAKSGGIVQSASLDVNPCTVQSLSVNPKSFIGGSSAAVIGTVTLTGSAPTGGATVTLKSSDSKSVSLPATIKVPAGAKSVGFPVTHFAVQSNQSVTISGSLNGQTSSTGVTVNPFQVISLVVNPVSVTGGTTVTATATLNGVVGRSSAISIHLTSNSTSATVPSTLTFAGGNLSGKFTVTTKAVSVDTQATITASIGSSSSQATLTLKAPILLGLTVSPTSVKGSGSTNVNGVVTISSPAPAGGLTVMLSSAAPGTAQCPTSVVIPAGRSSITFKVSHSAVTSTQSVAITGSLNGISKSATLTVTP